MAGPLCGYSGRKTAPNVRFGPFAVVLRPGGPDRIISDRNSQTGSVLRPESPAPAPDALVLRPALANWPLAHAPRQPEDVPHA